MYIFDPPLEGGSKFASIAKQISARGMQPLKQSRVERRSEFKRAAAKMLRVNATDYERKLWSLLRGKQFARLRFRKQQPVGAYIVDFFCPAAKLVIKLDGEQHGTPESIAYDTRADSDHLGASPPSTSLAKGSLGTSPVNGGRKVVESTPHFSAPVYGGGGSREFNSRETKGECDASR